MGGGRLMSVMMRPCRASFTGLNDICHFTCKSVSSLSIGRQYCSESHEDNVHKRGESPRNTYDASEVEKFSRLSKHWWNEGGEFGALHSLNKLRVPLVRDSLAPQGNGTGSDATMAFKPLHNLKILDIGCGGGILSEPLARLGANVTGVDASSENIATAEHHAKQDPDLQGHLTYRCSLVEDLAREEGAVYDGVVASEVLEHVKDPSVFVRACCELVKPGGSVFFTTINQTALSYVLGIFAAERVLRIVPAGSHDWNKFISPDNLSNMLSDNDFTTRLIHGMCLNPFTLQWSWMADTSINYALQAVRPEDVTTETSRGDTINEQPESTP